MITPSLRVERRCFREGAIRVAGMDEVGRGAVAGPVSVGVVVVTAATPTAPKGLRDSKLIAVAKRQSLEPQLYKWAVAAAVGHASAQEIDSFGIMAALQSAGRRALLQVGHVDHVLLDGNYDWLTRGGRGRKSIDIRDTNLMDAGVTNSRPRGVGYEPRVTTLIKGDQRCSSIAAASVVAKVTRDRLMCSLAEETPDYDWDQNKGYSSSEHLAAIRRHGLSDQHRASWQIAAAQGHGAPAESVDQELSTILD